eukprot:5891819-Amphidinium_carterae.1
MSWIESPEGLADGDYDRMVRTLLSTEDFEKAEGKQHIAEKAESLVKRYVTLVVEGDNSDSCKAATENTQAFKMTARSTASRGDVLCVSLQRVRFDPA